MLLEEKNIDMKYESCINVKNYISISKVLITLLLFICNFYCFSQEEKKFIREGNKQYYEKKYEAAEKKYLQGLIKNKDSYKSAFNLGDAYYQQGKYEEAAEQFQSLTHRATAKDTLSKAYHNLGNSLMKTKKYQEGLDAYKNALKNNPNDEDSRYNYAYAQQMLQQQKQQQQKDKDNKDKKDKKDNKDDKDKKDNKDKDNKDKKDKDKKDEDKKEEEKKNDKENKDKQEQKPQQNKISKEDAQRLLDALQNDEKNLQDKIKKDKMKGVKVKIEKDW